MSATYGHTISVVRAQNWVLKSIVLRTLKDKITQMHAEHIIHSKLWKGFLKHHLLHCISTNWSRDLSCDEDLLTFYLKHEVALTRRNDLMNAHIRHKESRMSSKYTVYISVLKSYVLCKPMITCIWTPEAIHNIHMLKHVKNIQQQKSIISKELFASDFLRASPTSGSVP